MAGNKAFVAQKIGEFTTLGIPLGVAVIVFAWVLTAIYVVWANKSYDPEVERLRSEDAATYAGDSAASPENTAMQTLPRYPHRRRPSASSS